MGRIITGSRFTLNASVTNGVYIYTSIFANPKDVMNRPTQRNWDKNPHPAMTYQPPEKLRRFQAAMALVVSALLVLGLWTLTWFAAETWAKSSITNWMEAQRALGAEVGYEALETSGFPSRIILTITKPAFAGPLMGQSVDWVGETLTVATRPWMPWKLHVEAPGRHQLKLGDGAITFPVRPKP